MTPTGKATACVALCFVSALCFADALLPGGSTARTVVAVLGGIAAAALAYSLLVDAVRVRDDRKLGG